MFQFGFPVAIANALGEILTKIGFDAAQAFELGHVGKFVNEKGRIGGPGCLKVIP